MGSVSEAVTEAGGEELSEASVPSNENAPGAALSHLCRTVTCDVYEDRQQRSAVSELYTTATVDGYEDSQYWDWAGPRYGWDGSVPVPTEPAYVEPYEQTQPVGMVMVPASAMPAYTQIQPPPLCFPGCVAVPMDRFGLWPGDFQANTLAHAAPSAEDHDDVEEGHIVDGGHSASRHDFHRPEHRPEVLKRAFSVSSNMFRIRWTICAWTLKKSDREAVSPAFDLNFSDGVMQFKMVLRSKAASRHKGGASFKKGKGRGRIELRCVTDVDPSLPHVVNFQIAVGSSVDSTRQQECRGPVRHDFSQRPVCGLPPGQDEWDFRKSVDEATQTFVVCLEILSDSD